MPYQRLTVRGDALRRVRLAAAMTQADLAREAGVIATTISHMEGSRKARPTTVRKVAAALGVDPRDIATLEAP